MKKYIEKYKHISKYTSISYLDDILKGNLYASDGEKWEDKNDAHIIKTLKEYRVTCLTISYDRHHFWKTFSSIPHQNTIRIVFDLKKFITSVQQYNDIYAMGMMYYINHKDLKNTNNIKEKIEKILSKAKKYERKYDKNLNLIFLKNKKFISEREFRIIVPRHIKYIKFDIKAILEIYINPWIEYNSFKCIKDCIEKKIKKLDVNINIKRSTHCNSKEWIENINNIIKK